MSGSEHVGVVTLDDATSDDDDQEDEDAAPRADDSCGPNQSSCVCTPAPGLAFDAGTRLGPVLQETGYAVWSSMGLLGLDSASQPEPPSSTGLA